MCFTIRRLANTWKVIFFCRVRLLLPTWILDYRIICSDCWVVGDWTCIKQSFNAWQSYCLGVWINRAKNGIIRDCLMSFFFSQIIFIFNKRKIDNYMKKILIKKLYILQIISSNFISFCFFNFNIFLFHFHYFLTI